VIWPRRRAALKIRSMYPLSFAVEIDAIVQFREYQGPRSTPGTLTSEPGHCGDLRSPVVPDVHVPCFAGGHFVTRVGVVPGPDGAGDGPRRPRAGERRWLAAVRRLRLERGAHVAT